ILGSLAVPPRAAGVPVGISSAHLGGRADGELLRLSGKQFHVLGAATVPSDCLAMDESAAVWRTSVHALVADRGRKAKATGGSSPFVGGCLGRWAYPPRFSEAFWRSRVLSLVTA